MNEPRRILDQGGDGLSSRLLRSADADAPGDRSWQKAMAAVGAATATSAAGSSVAAAAGSGQALLISKWIGFGLLSGALVAAGLSALRKEPESPAAPPVPTAAAVVEVPAPEPAAVVRHSDPEPVVTAEEPAPKVLPRATAIPSEPTPPPAAGPSVAAFGASAPPSLAEEQRWVERVRQRLSSGDAAGALAAADQYDAAFKPRRFGQEVAVLRIDALVRLGRCAEARSIAVRFHSAHPDSALAQRVSSLIAPCVR